MAEQTDPFRASQLLIMIPTSSIETLALENLMRKHTEREKFPQPDQMIKFWIDAEFSWKQLKSDNISWQNMLTSSYKLQRQWHVVSTRYQKTIN